MSPVLTEEFRPKTQSDLIGNPQAIEKLKAVIQEGRKCIVHGDPGIGKTSSVYALAADLGITVYETNASDERQKEDLEHLYERTMAKGLCEHLYLLDEVDGVKDWAMIEKIVTKSRHPIVLIANEYWKIPKKIRDMCEEIRFFRPQLQDVVKRVKQISTDKEIPVIDYSAISTDVRSSITSAFYGGERREFHDMFVLIDRLLRGHGDPSFLKKEELLWVLDNLPNYYTGRKLFEAQQILSIAARTTVAVLKLLPEGKGKPEYPYTLRMRRMTTIDNKQ